MHPATTGPHASVLTLSLATELWLKADKDYRAYPLPSRVWRFLLPPVFTVRVRTRVQPGAVAAWAGLLGARSLAPSLAGWLGRPGSGSGGVGGSLACSLAHSPCGLYGGAWPVIIVLDPKHSSSSSFNTSKLVSRPAAAAVGITLT
jgi:hypothetical protein